MNYKPNTQTAFFLKATRMKRDCRWGLVNSIILEWLKRRTQRKDSL